MPQVDKQYINDEIQRTARENEGKPLGVRAFERETGIKVHEWEGVYWAKWSEALIENGFSPNSFQEGYDDEYLLLKLTALIRDLGRYPTEAERKLQRRSDDTFPSEKVFRRFGNKHELAKRVIEYCRESGESDDVIAICEPLAEVRRRSSRSSNKRTDDTSGDGFVYLMKHGTSGQIYKLGFSNHVGRRHYQLNLQTPEELRVVHEIRTDDPSGIEAYWKKRWADKQHRNEYYRLTGADVRAFKRRKFM